MSEEDNGGGESSLLFSDCDVDLAFSSGDADKLARRAESVGMLNSTGGAREACECCGSVTCDDMVTHKKPEELKMGRMKKISIYPSKKK